MARYPKGTTPKLTEEIIEKLCDLIRKGAYIETAVAYCGICKDTFYRWLKEGARTKEDNLFKKLTDALWVAQAESEMRDLYIIDKAAQGSPDILARDEHGNLLLDSNGYPMIQEYGMPPNWKAAAWRLERRHPNHWGRKSQIQQEHNVTSEHNDSCITVEFVGHDD